MPTDIVLSDSTSAAIAALEGGAQRFVEALAEEIRDRFQDNVHVITGAMKASASVITASGSDYAEHVAVAGALNPKATFAPQEQVGPNEAVVQVPISYAMFEEAGTVHRAGHPAFIPAIESTVADAESIARTVFRL